MMEHEGGVSPTVTVLSKQHKHCLTDLPAYVTGRSGC
jgi:hypothetical protein